MSEVTLGEGGIDAPEASESPLQRPILERMHHRPATPTLVREDHEYREQDHRSQENLGGNGGGKGKNERRW